MLTPDDIEAIVDTSLARVRAMRRKSQLSRIDLLNEEEILELQEINELLDTLSPFFNQGE